MRSVAMTTSRPLEQRVIRRLSQSYDTAIRRSAETDSTTPFPPILYVLIEATILGHRCHEVDVARAPQRFAFGVQEQVDSDTVVVAESSCQPCGDELTFG